MLVNEIGVVLFVYLIKFYLYVLKKNDFVFEFDLKTFPIVYTMIMTDFYINFFLQSIN